MRRILLVIAAMGVALLSASGIVLLLDLGLQTPSVAQAQTQDQQSDSQIQGAPGGTEKKGVTARIEQRSRQVVPESRLELEPPPLGLTERGKAALEQARQGNAQPAERKKISPQTGPSSQQQSSGDSASSMQSDAPVLGTSFQGVTDTNWFPPDHQIAAGPNNIVVATNGAVNVRKKDGTLLSSQTLGGFFSPLGAEHSGAFDPWLAYDPYIDRFWIMAVSRDTATQRSDMVIGLSNTSDATLGWTLWELNASVNGSTNTTNWCDYPKLGFDAQAIYVTCNMFAFGGGFQYSKIRTMTKSQFVNNTSIFWWDRWDLKEGNCSLFCGTAFTIQPAQMFGASASTGEFLVDAHGGGGTGSTFDVWRVTNAAECCDGDSVGPTFSHQNHGVGSYGPSDGARQSGSTTQINNGDSRLLYAFWQGGKLSTGHTVACGSGGADACAGFTELNVSSFPTISTTNNWILHTAGVDYYYPAVAPNYSAGNKTMVYSRSSSSEFASARYIGIPSSSICTLCVNGPETILQNGQNSYVRLDGIGRNRWGDYSGASPDPNGTGVWVAGEFATATANTWGVQVGLTYQSSPPPTNDNFADAQTISGINTSANGTTRWATREPNEPDHSLSDGWIGDHSVWYRWTAPASGLTTLDTCTANIDSILAVYTGGSLGTLSRVADNNNNCPSGWGSKLTFNAVAGMTYRIAVGDAGGLRENTFTLKVADAAPPDTTITSGPSGVTNDNTPTFTFSGSDNATPSSNLLFSYKVDGGAWSPYSSSTNVTLGGTSGLSDGPHTFYVKARDQAGNEDPTPAQRSFAVDTVAPSATINSGPSGIVNSTSASFTFSSNETGVTFNCSLNGGGFGTCISPKNYAGLADGSHEFRVRATDIAGNTGPAASRTWTVDTTAPTVSSVSPADGATGVEISTNVTATFSEAMDASTIKDSTFTLTNQEATSPVAATVSYDAATKKATLNPEADLQAGSTYTVTVKGSTSGVKDSAGNALAADKSWSFTIVPPSDTTPPNTTITSGPSGFVKSTSASFGFSSSEAGSKFQCRLDGAGFSACSSPKSYSSLSQGKHTFRVRAIDAAGNIDSTPATRTFTVDTVKPTVSGMLPKPGSTTTDTTPTIKATVKDNMTNLRKANIKLYVNGKLISATKYSYSAATDVLTYNSPKLAKGKKVVKIVAADAATNVGAKSWYFTIK